MGNRKLVPAALHSELTEYSSLIRALRASNTLDVTAHLTNAEVGRIQDLDTELGSDDDDTDDDLPENLESSGRHETAQSEHEYDTDPMAFPPTSSAFQSREASPSPGTSSAGPATPRKRKRTSSSPPPQRRRDPWTRWPLLAHDVFVPEWSFEDEIGYLAERTLKDHPRPSLPLLEAEDRDQGHEELQDTEDIDHDTSYLPHLTLAASNHLSTILALLVAHTPNRPDSQQNRVEPMSWRAVLDVLSSCGDPSVADLKIINTVKTRMEALYGSVKSADHANSEVLVAHRIQCSQSAKQKLRAQLAASTDDFLFFPEMPTGWTPPIQRPPRRARRSASKKSAKTC